VTYDVTDDRGVVYPIRIRHQTSRLLRDLVEAFDGDVVWATTWLDASDVIGPLVGLTSLEHAIAPGIDLRRDVPRAWSPKTPWVRLWAHDRGVRRLVWLDDDLGPADHSCLTSPRRVMTSTASPDDAVWRTDWRQILAHTDGLDEAHLIHVDPAYGISTRNVREAIAARTVR
jgi:hypothetical protein